MSAAQTDALVEKIFQSMLGFQEITGLYLGEKLGLYQSLHHDGPATSTALAARTETDERYIREWLEQQAVSGILSVDDVAASSLERVYALPADYAPVLIEPEDPNYLGAAGPILLGSIRPIDRIVDGYRTGAGVPFEEYGPDMVCGTAAFNRPAFMNSLGSEWIPMMPDVDAALRRPGAKVADVGMGSAWSSIAIAQAYPEAAVDGYDLDETSVAIAKKNIRDAGLSGRVTATVRDAGDLELSGQYDLACACVCIHDMSDPVAALRAMRRLVADRGTVLVLDIKVQDAFIAPGDDVERTMYGFSIVHCLPVSRVDTPSAATGTMIRRSIMEGYAREAGFASIEVLPIENDFYRFYRMTG